MQWPTPMPKWLDHAFRYRGLREVPGKKHNPTIIKWLKSLKAWWSEDETPWCGTFIAHCMREAGFPIIQHWYRAKAWMTYGTATSLTDIPFGAICVKGRQGGGHVFFAVAKSPDGSIIYGLGGNQSNCVNIASFKRSDILAARWPQSVLQPKPLPVASSAAQLNAAGVGGTEN